MLLEMCFDVLFTRDRESQLVVLKLLTRLAPSRSLMRRRLLDTDTVGAHGLEKQNGGGSRNKRLVSPAASQF